MKTIQLKATAKVAIKRSILKVYTVDNVNTVYLKNGTEFEIELFNPTQDTLLCKFKFNGSDLNGGGMILYPGQRVFLERYLDQDKKFKFETYDVENSPEVEYAIAQNGLLEISFYKQYVKPIVTWTTGTYGGYNSGSIFNNTPFIGTCTTNSFYSTTADSMLCSSASSNSKSLDLRSSAPELKETGRISAGEKSNQKFDYVDMDFNPYATYLEFIKILPESEKVYEASDIKHRKYCAECGSKIKQTDKFCSNCGDKL